MSSHGTANVKECNGQEIAWLWRGRIARGRITLIDGNPGVGKSLLTLDLAARLSKGSPMPDQSNACEPASTLIISNEDNLEDTIIPRLVVAGADSGRVFCWDDKVHGRLVLPARMERLARAMVETKSGLVFLDPLSAFLDVKSSGLNEVTRRRVLEPLARLARDTKAAIVLIRHLRKHGAGTPALQCGLGSSDIPAIARVMLLVGVDPENEERRVLACSKNNLAERPSSLGFRIVGTDSGVARLEWLGPVPLTADELVERPRAARRDAVSEAMAFLRERLADGPCSRSQLLDEAAALGLSLRTLERAKAELGIVSRQGRDNGAKAWYWSLGEMPEPAAGDR